jgi:hypothetical protein
MNTCRAVLNTWWKLIQALADPSLDAEVRSDAAPDMKVLPQQHPVFGSTTTLALSQLGLLEDGRELS